MAQNNEGSWGLLTHGVGTGLGLDSKAGGSKKKSSSYIKNITALT